MRHETQIVNWWNGRDRKAGAVAQVRTVRNPIRAARYAMEQSGRVMFAGKAVDDMAAKAGLDIVDPEYFITPRRVDGLKRAMAGNLQPMDRYGTVGAVAMDVRGNLAAATSTGGLNAKPAGRVGDSPIIGAGTYADNASCAVSATGDGEYFIRASVARMICARVAMQHMSAGEAAQATLDEITAAVRELDAQVWGQAFEPPLFCDEVEVVSQRLVGEKHLALKLMHQGQPVLVVAGYDRPLHELFLQVFLCQESGPAGDDDIVYDSLHEPALDWTARKSGRNCVRCATPRCPPRSAPWSKGLRSRRAIASNPGQC